MTTLSLLLLVTGAMLILGILSSKVADRVGMPGLVLFLGLGMLAGSDGLGIAFEDYDLANRIGSLALGLILFDGGLRTSAASLREAWKPALVLATLGVVITAGVTGAAAAWLLGVPLLVGLLLGGIVGSTDAAAVFSVLRTSGLKLPDRLASTLEVESGSNDPMAVFLTLGLTGVIAGTSGGASGLAALLGLQMGVGAVVGVGVGVAGAWVVNRIRLDHAGLYPVLVLAVGMVSFGLAAVLHGSGFLAVYLTGLVLADRVQVFRRGILLFHDATAWLGQILLFVMLGLLSFPSQLLGVVGPALGVALVLLLVARPLAVVLSTLPFGFRPREVAFVSWVGLKGAVPITLATFPLTAGIAGAETLFNVVFFVVIVSAVTQGWSLAAVAKRLGLGRPADPAPPLSVEISALRHVEGEITDYTVPPSARVAGQELRALALPDGAAATLVVRGTDVIVPRGTTALRPGDHVFVAMHRRLKPLIDRLFDAEARTPDLPDGLALAFRAETTLGQLHRFFGLPAPTWSEVTLGEALSDPSRGTPPRLGPFVLSPGDEPDYVLVTHQPEIPRDAVSNGPPEAISAGSGAGP